MRLYHWSNCRSVPTQYTDEYNQTIHETGDILIVAESAEDARAKVWAWAQSIPEQPINGCCLRSLRASGGPYNERAIAVALRTIELDIERSPRVYAIGTPVMIR